MKGKKSESAKADGQNLEETQECLQMKFKDPFEKPESTIVIMLYYVIFVSISLRGMW